MEFVGLSERFSRFWLILRTIYTHHTSLFSGLKLSYPISFALLFVLFTKKKLLFSSRLCRKMVDQFPSVYARRSAAWNRASDIFTRFVGRMRPTETAAQTKPAIFNDLWSQLHETIGILGRWRREFLIQLCGGSVAAFMRANYDPYSRIIRETEMRNRRWNEYVAHLLVIYSVNNVIFKIVLDWKTNYIDFQRSFLIDSDVIRMKVEDIRWTVI